MRKVTDLKEVVDLKEVLFMVPMRPFRHLCGIQYTSSNDAPVMVPAMINEERYKLADNFKITLEALYEGFGKRDYYRTDLLSMIHCGEARMYRQVKLEKE